jgi:hypothetical protein
MESLAMSVTEAADRPSDEKHHVHTITVTVNFKHVSFTVRLATGLEIKQAAIAQGVKIQLDFVLFRDKGHGRRDPIRDDQSVDLQQGEKFEAVPGDDNS